MKEIWLEKYRPKLLNQVYGNTQPLNTLKACVQQGNIPHLILTGPPGTGKTSSVLCIVNELLGQANKHAIKQLNASDQRGIDVVRTTIKTFAQKQCNLPKGMTKVIILDEADSLTQGAQQALRMIISNFSDTTRFVLSCNNSSKIIQPIQSRCIILRFSKLKDIQVQNNLNRVLKKQNVKISQRALKCLLFIADGDMRQALNNLQACHFASKGQQIRQQLVLHICDAPSIDQMKDILKTASDGLIDQSLKKMHKLFQDGHSCFDIANGFYRILSDIQGQIRRQKVFQMMKYVSQLRARVVQGLSTQLQIAGFLSKCAKISHI